MKKIRGLVFDDYSELMDELFERVRIDLSLDREQFEAILETEKGQELFKAFDDTVTEFFLGRFTADNFKKELGIKNRNQKKIIKHNLELFRYYFAFVQTTHVVYQKLLDNLEENTVARSLEVRDVINIILYGNLCRLSEEIGLLLINGYPDGALILWRSFYEYSVVAVFLMKHNSNELSQKFKDASLKDIKRNAESYAKRHIDLKFPPLDEQISQRIQTDYDDLKNKYSKEFFENDYSWAKGFLNGKPNFINLEQEVGFSRYRPFYIWASGKSHPNYKELVSFRDSKDNIVLRYVTIQEMDKKSMVDPAQLTLSIFDQVNSYFLHLYSESYEYDTNMLMFRKIYVKFDESIS